MLKLVCNKILSFSVFFITVFSAEFVFSWLWIYRFSCHCFWWYKESDFDHYIVDWGQEPIPGYCLHHCWCFVSCPWSGLSYHPHQVWEEVRPSPVGTGQNYSVWNTVKGGDSLPCSSSPFFGPSYYSLPAAAFLFMPPFIPSFPSHSIFPFSSPFASLFSSYAPFCLMLPPFPQALPHLSPFPSFPIPELWPSFLIVSSSFPS